MGLQRGPPTSQRRQTKTKTTRVALHPTRALKSVSEFYVRTGRPEEHESGLRAPASCNRIQRHG
ncbi:hypothetical protein PENNAL_c0066G10555 [Penicillium nalgiovense]|uniref:Uncharacterized protein n=1 Tax=Penicillium nalgiovense TaxID=60175 RepID=A0A1V6XNB0_PENNA|nr:hypothetical protein PENNAL_c0066G10555 [Penicillium nalgiovense]